ncbi:hypothetical protein Tco_1122283 [Tanacetum coccineum]|uniref:Uncharacterized protein n=1 Tax=Tanacetum coccineum TaxID=301880 RepID=A0ABQ5J352_9ASTR
MLLSSSRLMSPPNKRYDLLDANKKLSWACAMSIESKILMNIIKNHPLRFSIAASASVPWIYMAQFWHTLKEDGSKHRLKYSPSACLHALRDGDQPPLQSNCKCYLLCHNIHVDYAELMWEGIYYSLHHLATSIPYPRFTKIIISHYMTIFPDISRRARDAYQIFKYDVYEEYFNSGRNKNKSQDLSDKEKSGRWRLFRKEEEDYKGHEVEQLKDTPMIDGYHLTQSSGTYGYFLHIQEKVHARTSSDQLVIIFMMSCGNVPSLVKEKATSKLTEVPAQFRDLKFLSSTKQVTQDIMEEISLTIDEAKLKKMADEMLRQRCTLGDEHQYHIDQMKNFLQSDIVWESRKEILVSPHPRKDHQLVQSVKRILKAQQ